jgi:hypothetical protein
MGELARSARATLEALQDPRNRVGLARLYQPRYIVLAPAVRTGTEVAPRGKPTGVFEYPEDLKRSGLRIPKGWCVVYTDNSSYAQRKYAITLEKARKMSDEELEAILAAQTLEFFKQRSSFWGWG